MGLNYQLLNPQLLNSNIDVNDGHGFKYYILPSFERTLVLLLRENDASDRHGKAENLEGQLLILEN